MSSLESKARAAYAHGIMDYLAGAPCDPSTPLIVYDNLNKRQQKVVMDAWVDGWTAQSERGKA